MVRREGRLARGGQSPRFLRYAGRAARAFGHLTDEYITLFEPNELVWKKSANRNLNLRFKMLSHMACAMCAP